jgi:hypothetical protein
MDPVLKTDKWVYAEYFLRRTYDVLRGKRSIFLPNDFRNLVEAVYGDRPSNLTIEMENAYQKLLQDEEFARQEAEQRLVPGPDPEELFTGPAAILTFTESETDASWTIARTRLGEPSINVIPLEDLGDYFSFPGCVAPLKKSQVTTREFEMAMLRRQMRISHGAILQALCDQKSDLPRVFSKSPSLKDYLPLWLIDGSTEIQTTDGKYVVCLDPNLGLLVNKKGG